MKKLPLAFLALSLTALAFGCDKFSSKATSTTSGGSGGAAVVDLDKVAKAMGWNEEMKKNIDATKAGLADQFNEYLKPAKKLLETKRDEIATSLKLSDKQKEELNNAKSKDDLKHLNLSEKQIEELGQAFAFAYNSGNAATQKFNQIVDAQTQAIIKQYVDAVKPAVRRVAERENKSVVMMPNGNMLYNDAASDITDKVVDDMQHSNIGQIPMPPIPQLKFDAPPTPPSSSASSTPPASTPVPTPPVAPRPTPKATVTPPVTPPPTTNP